jgi:pyruvate dehydrogenase E1 component alpha subunit
MDKAQKAAAMAADPVPRFRAFLVENGVASLQELVDMEAGIEKDLDDAVEFALSSAFPGIEEMACDVLSPVQEAAA